MIFVGSDHAGLELKTSVIDHLIKRGIVFEDLGTYTCEPYDYAVIAEKVGNAVSSHHDNLGLLFCGTGVGISIAANKINGIRAACCSDSFSVRLTRKHNNANILCLGGRVLGTGLAFELVDIFLNTEFCNEERHKRRIDQISRLEQK